MKSRSYTHVLLNVNSHNPIISFIYCFKSIIKRPKKKVGMLKLQLITVIDIKYKIKIKFFFTEGLFLGTSYIYGLRSTPIWFTSIWSLPFGLFPLGLFPFDLPPLGLL